MQLFMGSTNLEVTMYGKALGWGPSQVKGLRQGDSQIQPNIFGNVPTHGWALAIVKHKAKMNQIYVDREVYKWEGF